MRGQDELTRRELLNRLFAGIVGLGALSAAGCFAVRRERREDRRERREDRRDELREEHPRDNNT